MLVLSPQMAKLEQPIAAITAQAEKLGGLSPEQWNWKAAPTDWSAVEILWHLNASASPLMPLFEAAIQKISSSGKGAIGDAPFKLSVLEKLFIKVVSPESSFNPPAPKMLTPPASGLSPDVELAQFLDLQSRFLQCIRLGNGMDLSQEKIPSPISPLLKLSVGAYITAMVQHERYHWLQIEDRLRGSGFTLGQ